jgi:hypothetical protein
MASSDMEIFFCVLGLATKKKHDQLYTSSLVGSEGQRELGGSWDERGK